jgi:hypothetical protein
MVRKLIGGFCANGQSALRCGGTHGGQRSALGPVMVASQHFFEAGAELRHSC